MTISGASRVSRALLPGILLPGRSHLHTEQRLQQHVPRRYGICHRSPSEASPGQLSTTGRQEILRAGVRYIADHNDIHFLSEFT